MIDIRPPHITGSTAAEQIRQLVVYLSRLVQQLRQLPEAKPVVREEDPQWSVRSSFQKLRVRKALTVDGGINGVYVRSISVWGSKEFTIKTQYKAWGADGNRQSFLLAGCMGNTPVLGMICVNSSGNVVWEGTSGISVATEPKGVVRVTLPYTTYDHFLLQSPEDFYI